MIDEIKYNPQEKEMVAHCCILLRKQNVVHNQDVILEDGLPKARRDLTGNCGRAEGKNT